MGQGDEGGLDGQSIAAITLGVLAWVSFLLAWFMLADAWAFLVLAVGFGVAALVLGLRAKRNEEAAVAAGATAAGVAMIYGMTLAAFLAALVYAMGVLFVLAIVFFLWWMSWMSSQPRHGGCACSGSADDGGGSGCCCCPADASSGSGGCCGGCGGGGCGCDAGCSGPDCGGGAGGGGCGCVSMGLAHHPDLPEYEADVYRLGGARLCIGCFTTYPVFVLASVGLLLAPLASVLALPLGGLLAALQGVSSAGLARARAAKVVVKTSLGLGLALLLHGVRQAPWAPGWKVVTLAATLGLALLSAVPRARRMGRARAARAGTHEACACGASSSSAR